MAFEWEHIEIFVFGGIFFGIVMSIGRMIHMKYFQKKTIKDIKISM